MTSKLFVFLFISLGFVNGSFAAKVCAKNAKDLAQLKDSFPKFFQNKNEVGLAQIDPRAVAMRFQITDDIIIAQYSFKFLGTHGDIGYATQICYNKDTKELDLTMDNGKDVTVMVENESPTDATVTVHGQRLTRSPSVYSRATQSLGGYEKTLRQTYEEKKGAQ